jgi:hypothetical protein
LPAIIDLDIAPIFCKTKASNFVNLIKKSIITLDETDN